MNNKIAPKFNFESMVSGQFNGCTDGSCSSYRVALILKTIPVYRMVFYIRL